MIDLFEPIIGADFPKKVIPLIKKATKNIDIVIYDWRWYADEPAHPVQLFNMALVQARNRGVQIRAILNSKDLLPLLNSVGIKAKQVKDKRLIHSKLLIIDNEILILGSHNFSRNAFGSNIETSLALRIPETNDRFSVFFNNLYNL